MGSLLVLIWSSLRWSDALSVTPSALTEDVDVIRGIAARTKTTSRGMPFAFVKSGLLATSTQVTWSMKWLNLVRQALQRTSEVFPDFTPDFLLPLCGPSVDHPMFTAPMPGAQGVLLLRRLLLQANKDASVLSIGVHSPKVTLLSWARQIGASEEARMAGPSSPVRRSVQCGLVRPRRCAPSNTVTVPDYSVHSIRFPASDFPPTRWS